MKMAHLLMDMQSCEFYGFSPQGKVTLIDTVLGLKHDLAKYDVQTITVTSQLTDPIVGKADVVESVLLQRKKFKLSGGRLGLVFPLAANEIVAVKTTCSAYNEPILQFLQEHKIDTLVFSGLQEGEADVYSEACLTRSAIHFARNFRTIIASEGTNYLTRTRGPLPRLSHKERCDAFAKYGVEVMPVRDILNMAQTQKAPNDALIR